MTSKTYTEAAAKQWRTKRKKYGKKEISKLALKAAQARWNKAKKQLSTEPLA